MLPALQFDSSPENIGLRVTVQNDVDGRSADLLFKEFPVRIGRNTLNELVLNHPYVSQWHAVVGFVRGALSVIQVGSTNSIEVNTRKLQPNDELALARDATLRLMPFTLQLQLVSLGEGQRKRREATSSFVAAAAAEGNSDAALARVALSVMRRLAQRYLGEDLHDPKQLARFGMQVEQVLDVFLRCFVALKAGQTQFRETLDMRALQPRKGDRVGAAESDAALAAALFQGEDSARGAQSLEQSFKDIMIHQVALLNGTMAGVRNLLGKISPKAVHKLVAKRSTRNPSAKALWEAFGQLHHDLSEEDTAAFDAVFGRQFDKAYATVAKGGTVPRVADAEEGSTRARGARR